MNTLHCLVLIESTAPKGVEASRIIYIKDLCCLGKRSVTGIFTVTVTVTALSTVTVTLTVTVLIEFVVMS